jgi:Domain of unknown function (DUF6484)
MRSRLPRAPLSHGHGHATLTANAALVEGRVVSVDAEGRPHVEFEGNVAGPLLARSLVSCGAVAWTRRAQPVRVLLGFEGIDTSQPIILGWLDDSLVALEPAPVAAPLLPRRVEIDGREISLIAHEQLVLRCGSASITLCANGSIVIKGGELQSRARGRNRISGSTVAIN